jgi:hypothetical protein
MRSRIAILLGVSLVLGCTFINATSFLCDDDSNCPSGFVCGGKGFCVAGAQVDGGSTGTDGGEGNPGDGGMSPDAGVLLPPSDLTYLVNPATYYLDTTIYPNSPSSSGGAVTSYSVSPALPAGLTLSPTTGIVTGAPTAVSALTSYKVTASNASGSTTATLMISVTDSPCSAQMNMSCPNKMICDLSNMCTSPQYSASGGVVTDNVTHLMWQQMAPANPCSSDGMGVCTLAHAMTYCQGLSLNGTGWTLPTVTQLYTLVDMGSSPAIDASDFPSFPANPFWTSTADGTGYGWTVDFSDGYAVSGVGTTLTASVLCVKG